MRSLNSRRVRECYAFMGLIFGEAKDPTIENKEIFMNRIDVKGKIAEELKSWLVDDWDLITWQKQLFYLSAQKNVDSILEDYANYKESRETKMAA
ncbi:hypothetical protein QTO34_002046 [Cnephaeus nilssonii]|uniref:MRG domain-containing protein n=1 Tax=Cnephaeus nilssonii TaxID=3371016 RepID=A0AA40HU58_CNENI|nr:hypothetical protein QTO34_002046 [Eptesicus nilssonii]